MKILLVSPAISSVGFDSYGRKGLESSWINHGLASLSACVKKDGHEVGLLDLRRLRDWNEYIAEVEEFSPDVIGVTMISVDFNPALKSMELAKSSKGSIITAAGGAHPSLMPQELENHDYIDHIFIGEGEISFPLFLKDLESGGKPEKIIVGSPPDLEKIPFADRELFGPFEHPIHRTFARPFITIIAGRGCRYNCNFCQPAERKIFGKSVRRRSVNNIIQELKNIREKYGFRSFLIHDDCLLEDRRWIEEFCDAYRDEKFNQVFACQGRADLICRNEKLIKKMRDAGLRIIIIGFESGSQRVLDFLRKGTKVEQNYKAAEICREHKIKVWANYMLGIPTETREEVMKTVQMIRTIKPDICSPSFYTPHPGSDLFEFCLKNDLSLIKTHESYRRSPTEAKIKGVDYEFLNNALIESLNFNLRARLINSRVGKALIPRIRKILKPERKQ